MTTRTDYTTKEWETLHELPYLVGTGIATVSQSGIIGKIREAISILPAISKSAQQVPGNTLIQELLASYIESQVEKAKKVAEPINQVAEKLKEHRTKEKYGPELGKEEIVPLVLQKSREAMSILEQKSTREETEAYKRWLLLAAEHVAKVSRSGGFLLIGSKLIDDNEAAFLKTLRETLGLPVQG